MAYVQHSSVRERPFAAIGVIAIHAVVGYALVTGLDFEKIVERIENPDAVDVFVELPPPPPPSDPVIEPQPAQVDPAMVVPIPPIPLPATRPMIDSTPVPQPLPDIQPRFVPTPVPQPTIPARPAFEAQKAKPLGNPARWVTVDDYRSNWINREMTGITRFRLDIGTSGRVENCTITGSSGHPELDRATCSLVINRARFDPSTDSSGMKVAGTYSNSVRWELPE